MENYFDSFPVIFYNNDPSKEEKILLTDITKRVVFTENFKNRSSLYIEYELKDSDSLESVCHKLYNTIYPDWVLYLLNGIINPYNDLPKEKSVLEKMVKRKYGDGNEDDINHYEDSEGNIIYNDENVDVDGEEYIVVDGIPAKKYKTAARKSALTPVTNFEYESKINESKRKIKILKPEYLRQILSEFSEKVKE